MALGCAFKFSWISSESPYCLLGHYIVYWSSSHYAQRLSSNHFIWLKPGSLMALSPAACKVVVFWRRSYNIFSTGRSIWHWNRRTVHSPTFSDGNSWIPADSSGIRLSQIPACLGVTRAKLAYLFREESGGVHWKPAYSGGVHGIHPDFFRWGSPLDSGRIQWNNQTPAKSNRITRLWRNSAESSGIQWTPSELIYSVLI